MSHGPGGRSRPLPTCTAAGAGGAPLGGRAGDDLCKEPLDWAPGELRRMRRWHPDCGPGCGGRAVADAPPVGAVRWPPDWRPPERWGAGCGGDAAGSAEQRLAAAFTEAHDGLEAISRCPGAVVSAGAARGETAAGPGSGERAAPQPMLEWLLQLPAQWEAADFPEDFGHFRVWKLSGAEFVAQGGSRFYAGDIVCGDGLHTDRAEEGRLRSCCAVADALQVLRRILARLDPDSEAARRSEYWEWWQMGALPLPEVPAGELARLPVPDVIEGFLGTFLYTYNLRAPPPGGERPLQIYGAANWAMRECADADGQHAARLERALSIFKPLIWRLDRFISAMKCEGGMLFRGLSGVRMGRYYSVGKYVLLPSITSLSRSGAVAWEFAGSDGGTWVSVQAISALNARWASFAEDEEELVFGSNTVLVVTDKPTDDERQVLSTTHDAVGLAQVGDAAGGTLRPLGQEATVSLRLQGMAEKSVIFRDFVQQYVEPSVSVEDDGMVARQGSQGGCAVPIGGGMADRRQEKEADHGEQRQALSVAFDSFLRSKQQWLLLVAPQATGKSSALLWLYYQRLCAMRATAPWQGVVPVFLSLPLVNAAALAGSEPWLAAQLRRQLHIDEAGWQLLAARGLLVFADSADEALLQPEKLRERSLAARAELPQGSKGVISVREEDLHRLSLTPRDVAGSSCLVLRLLPFAERERQYYIDKLIERQVKDICERLRKIPLGESCFMVPMQATIGLPGCVPEDTAEELHCALRESKSTTELKKRYKAEAVTMTRDRLKQIPEADTLVFTMAAEAADAMRLVPPTRDTAIEYALHRRMVRGAARVDPATWAAAGVLSGYEQTEALMRVAEAVAAALTLRKQWTGQIGPVAEIAAPLSEVGGGAAVLRALLPGLPLRTASAEDAASPFSLLHRQVQEWLAAQWAARAAERGRGEEALEVAEALSNWAGAWGFAAKVVERVAHEEELAAERAVREGAKRAPAMRSALQARIRALSRQPDQQAAAAELQKVVAECEELYGEDFTTADALHSLGRCLVALTRSAEAVAPLRRALALRRRLPGAEPGDTQRELALALIDSGALGEAEELAAAARAACSPGGKAELLCIGCLAALRERRGEPDEALRLRTEQLEGLESALGRDHPEVLPAVSAAAATLEGLSRWAEALPLRRRAHRGWRRAVPLGHPRLVAAATQFAVALYRTGQAEDREEAEALLRVEGVWEERQKGAADRREAQLLLYRRLGAERYAAVLQKGQDTPCSRAWHFASWPELLPELDRQLRRVAEGLEPFEDPVGNANALYRTGQSADREAAEALLRANGLWEQRQTRVAETRGELLLRYRRSGAVDYAALLREDEGTTPSRAWCEVHLPELLPELDEQVRRAADGLEPLEDPEGNASALYRTGRPADREAADALLRGKGLWEERQRKVAQYREELLQRYRRHGAGECAAHLQKLRDVRRAGAWSDMLWPELVPEMEEQLRRVAEGLEPFEDPDGNANALYRTGKQADREAAEGVLRAAGLWEQRQEAVASNLANMLKEYRKKGAALYGQMLRGENVRQSCTERLPELLADRERQLCRLAEGRPPFDDPEGNANDLYRSRKPADHAAADALLRAAGLWEQRQKKMADRRAYLLERYRKNAHDCRVLLQGGMPGEAGARQWYTENCPEMMEESEEQLRRIFTLMYPFDDPEGRANDLYRNGRPAPAAALLRAEGLWEERRKKVAARRSHLVELYSKWGAARYGALLRGEVEGECNERQWCDENCPEMVEEVDEQLRRMAGGAEPFEDPASYRAGQCTEPEPGGIQTGTLGVGTGTFGVELDFVDQLQGTPLFQGPYILSRIPALRRQEEGERGEGPPAEGGGRPQRADLRGPAAAADGHAGAAPLARPPAALGE